MGRIIVTFGTTSGEFSMYYILILYGFCIGLVKISAVQEQDR